MNRAAFCLSLLVLSAATSLSQETTRGVIINNSADSVGTNYALVVGISSYANISPLKYADDDAYLFADYLINQKICKKGDVTILIDSVATEPIIIRQLKRIFGKAKPNDRVFIYFAGHGDVETDIESGFLLAYDCEPNNYLFTDAINIVDLENFVSLCGKKNIKVVLITDACRSGNLAGGMTGARNTISLLSKRWENVIKILSCQPDQLSIEKNYPGGGHGVFTYHLIDGLSGLADTDNDNSISLKELKVYLENEVATETSQQQDPLTDGNLKTKIASYSNDLKLALIARKGDKTGLAVNTKRGDADTTWQSNIYFRPFTEHIRKQRLTDPPGNNAYATLLDAEKNVKSDKTMIYDMQLELAAVLEDEAQKWIHKYLRGTLEIKKTAILNGLAKVKRYMDVLEMLIGKDDFRYSEIHVKKIFFDAYFIFNLGQKERYPAVIEQLENAIKMMPAQAWLYHVLGMLYSEIKKYDLAELAEKNAIKYSPFWAYPWNALGTLYTDAKKNKEAEAALKKSIELDSSYSHAWVNLGNLYEAIGKNAEAEATFRKAIAIDPAGPYQWNGLGSIYYYQDKYAEAETAYKTAIQLDSAFDSPWSNLGNIYKMQGKDSLSEIAFQNATKINSADPYQWNGLGTLYYEQKKYDEAENAYKKAIQADSTSLVAWRNLADLYKTLDKYEQVEMVYSRISQLDSTDTETWNYLGKIRYDLKKYRASKEAYQKAIAIDPANAEAWNNLGSAYYELNDYPSAKKAYETAIGIDSSYAKHWYNVGSNFYKEDNFEQAEKALKKALLINPDYLYVIGLLADLYKDAGKLEEAEELFKRVISLDSTLDLGWHALGILYSTKMNRIDESITCFEKALSLNIKGSYTWDGLADALAKKRNVKASVEMYKKKAKYFPDDHDIPMRIAYVYLADRDFINAESHFNKALKLEPANPSSFYNLACLYSVWGKTSRALQNLEIAFKKGFDNFKHIATDPDMDNIRNDPSFINLVKKYKDQK